MAIERQKNKLEQVGESVTLQEALNPQAVDMTVHNLSGLPTIDYRRVKPLQGNLKDLSKANHYKLLKVLQKRGFTTPLFLWKNEDDYFLLDGHQRHRIMTQNNMNDQGSYEVPYVLVPAKDLKEAKEQLLEITSQYGHMTMEGLDEFAFDLDLSELDVNFDALDLDKYLDNLIDADETDDEAPEVDEVNPPVSVLGEVYQLGSHRLMCGSSTDIGNVEQLLDGAKPNMVFTDPPYNAAFNGRSGNHEVIMNDKLPTAEFNEFIAGFISTMYAVAPECPKYVCTDWKMYPIIYNLMQKPTACIVWVKNMFGMGNGYRHQHELIVFEGKLTANDKSDVWEIKRDNGADYDHPTQKPVALMAEAIKNSSSKGGVVLDFFLGSGSTLIASEKLGRACYGMELDPKYVDVIRKRYAKHIGEEDNWQEVTPSVQNITAMV